MGRKIPSSNFSFLEQHEPLLVRLGSLAERYFADDPNTSLLKLRQFGEVMSQHVAACVGLFVSPDEKQFTLLQRLWERKVMPPEVNQIFHGIRIAGNAAVHEHKGSHGEALHQLKMARKLAIWFHRSFASDARFHPGPFIPPTAPEQQDKALEAELEQLRKDLEASQGQAEAALAAVEEETQKRLSAEERAQQEAEDREIWEQLAVEYESKLAGNLAQRQANVQQNQSQEEIQAVTQHAYEMGQELDLSEAETRRLIDQQLALAGWDVDSNELTYKKGTRPQKGRNLAIAEWPVEGGRADYILFIGLEVVGVVEAKRKAKDVAAAIEQAKRYSRSYVIRADEAPPGGPWGEYKIPFLFSTNGRPFLEQSRTKSGIWFLDVRRPDNLSRPLTNWRTPGGLAALLKQDHDEAHKRLKEEPTKYLGLREYQIRAIKAVEQALEEDQRACLLAMATGTGKTRTCIGLVYRLLKTRRFRRVLFLVDRTALGEQAANAFKDTRLENLQTFADIFDIKSLGEIEVEEETKLHISTVQGMVKRILYPTLEDHIPAVDQYDCIVVDESHRGYNLDRELSELELDFRDQKSYISKYRRVLDHFDAVKIGLTATPALHTTEIFGVPVFQYGYREAVIDGWLVDHEPPTRIITALAEDGIHLEAGEEVCVYKPNTGEIDLMTLPDERSFEIDSYNKRVITENFNRVVCQTLVEHIDPSFDGKTLVFCATDAHADMVVDILKSALTERYGSIEDDAVVKITGSSDRPLQLIRRYRNERLPNIAVTVDLLTTGVDVPSICNLVFIRRVKSRILYEQMLGRATRLCPEIEKESFRIFDAVDLYAALEPFTSMKPVVTRPNIPFSQLAEELSSSKGREDVMQEVKDQFVAKLQQKQKRIKGEQLDHFEAIAHMPLEAFVTFAHDRSAEELADWLSAHERVSSFLDRSTGGSRQVIVSNKEDSLRDVRVGFGDAERPEDYLEGFNNYLQENMNDIPALITVLQRPRELTRKQLKELKMRLDEAGYSERKLRAAWNEMTNQDIAASIIGFIRQQALKEDLIPYERRVEAAIEHILNSQQWTPPQRKWLERIGKQIHANTIVDRTTLDMGEFRKQAGGFDRLNKVFHGRLDEILADVNEALWNKAG
ncbi:MAG TPA: type I restriction-modification system endonuclease [Myxococcales bacterium]|nr:type I restriction-modification system endonuclease [Deltaproteobacteria bacterium]HAA57589.1 type I restriction-modification system endonuclease [Myxococcales bacterium]|tara:strand:+ start:7155 stop:10535 length:3381 start_codon:yes stop_codon:yes gene_type:complete